VSCFNKESWQEGFSAPVGATDGNRKKHDISHVMNQKTMKQESVPLSPKKELLSGVFYTAVGKYWRIAHFAGYF